jgi:hypothetical protein
MSTGRLAGWTVIFAPALRSTVTASSMASMMSLSTGHEGSSLHTATRKSASLLARGGASV